MSPIAELVRRALTVGLAVALAGTVAGCGGGAVPSGGTAASGPTGDDDLVTTSVTVADGDEGSDSAATPGTGDETADADVDPEANGSPATVSDEVAPAVFPDGIDPSRIEIEAIGVSAEIIDLSLAGTEPEVPSDFADTGWYTQTRLPGEIGPAVVAGHIDSVDGPAVFARLDELEPGDEIRIVAEDGDERTFVVTGSGQYRKDALDADVFAFGEPVPELRLITCGGVFDRSSGHYRDNYVVYAEAT